MATAEQIRAAVKKADEQRIEERASAAAAVGELEAKRVAAADALAAAEEELRGAVRTAVGLMTPAELATFVGLREADVTAMTAPRGRLRSKRAGGGKGSRIAANERKAAEAGVPAKKAPLHLAGSRGGDDEADG